jgi:MFS family permease
VATAIPRQQSRIHRAWFVAGVAFVALVAAAAVRSSVGVFLRPISDEFNWAIPTVSFAISLNLAFYGLTAPFAAALMEKLGVRRVVCFALALLATGSALTTVISAPWQLYLFWGFFRGFGAGCMALVFGAVVAQRWFVERRGLVTGIFSAAFATGQLIFLPSITRITENVSWRAASLTLAAFAVAIIPFVLLWLRDSPADVGLLPYGAPADYEPPAPPSHGMNAATLALVRLKEASRTRAFWILAGAFFVCGWSTNGLIGTHFIAAAHDHALPATTAASLLAAIGVFDMVGTIGSGWFTDRYDSRYLLVIYYGLRGVSLLALHLVWASTVQPPMFFFVVLYGLDWVATVPPTVALCRECFGPERAGVVFGWVFAAHMVGAGISAWTAGAIRQATGSYDLAWWSAGILCLIAAAACWFVPRATPSKSAEPIPAPVPVE